jgi:hypothetical protein
LAEYQCGFGWFPMMSESFRDEVPGVPWNRFASNLAALGKLICEPDISSYPWTLPSTCFSSKTPKQRSLPPVLVKTLRHNGFNTMNETTHKC